MKRKTTLITVLFSFYLLHTFAQAPDSVLARVRYTYINKTDTLQNKAGHTENMLLFIGKNASLYTSYDKLNYEIADEQKFRASLATKASSGKPVAIIMEKRPPHFVVSANFLFFNKENKRFTNQSINLLRYLVEENTPETNWSISKDTLSFSGVKCQKAIANIDGKNWTAWFAPSLPFQAGPWKLYGLPGLIIAAYDEYMDVKFQFAGLENAKLGDHVRLYDISKMPNYNPNTYNALDQMIGMDVGAAYFENVIKLPRNAIKTNKMQLERLINAYKKDPKGFERLQYGN